MNANVEDINIFVFRKKSMYINFWYDQKYLIVCWFQNFPPRFYVVLPKVIKLNDGK